MKLAKHLKEISGLASDDRGRVFAHDDERGVVYRIDPMTGSILDYFLLGRTVVTEDFEGLAIAGEYFYLVTSNGDLYQFREGKDAGRVAYRVHRTPLDKRSDVEGLCYDPATSSLLLACKGDAGNGYGKHDRAVYSFDLRSHRLRDKPRFVLDERDFKDIAKGKEMRPSAIERQAGTGHFFILASQGHLLIEVDANGKMVAAGRLDADLHEQPEGLTFLPDGDMLISDEGKKHGRLSRYAAGKKR
ncbi:SdiA-regulated domain-containing protein [bacterium]|nr:SdiA-regulated domain-containing protein [bacterium]